jgi:acetyl/propionyl-CoA carboxylase alpha subunit
MKPIKNLLIANRGEIARRIMRTARAMGIRCVAVYEPEDQDALYVREADAAYLLHDGYLDQNRILEVCAAERVDAIHPGYGFLSENPAFVRRVEEAGITFIGPSAAAMHRMGEKTSARAEARAANVPLLPGEELDDGASLDSAERRKLVEKIGLPVVLKASAGGGGKAQAIIEEMAEVDAAFDKVLREAERLYRSRSIVVERYLAKARHIEVQILGNAAQQNFSLFDRDCSAQRNNQKIIEEAPAPNVPESIRAELHASAIRLANHVGYSNAGTMEYLYDSNRQEFYFLEMNTRLQVEHTVTEMVTGLDLVREQIRIAQGETTDYSAVTCRGHSLQARVCAEKSDGTWQPSTGEILQYIEPARVRIDSGVAAGQKISGKYDNMIAKVIVHASDRAAAIEELDTALAHYVINGIHTNIPLLRQLLRDPVFRDVRHYTRYLQKEFTPPQNNRALAATIAAIALYQTELQENRVRFGNLAGYTNTLR